jgi:hypothetical protein
MDHGQEGADMLDMSMFRNMMNLGGGKDFLEARCNMQWIDSSFQFEMEAMVLSRPLEHARQRS